MNIQTPNNIDVLLHYHVSPTVHERFCAPAVKDAVSNFVNVGALELDVDEEGKGQEGRYRTTPLGRAWVKALCSTKMPKPVFADEHGNILS